MTDPDTQKQKSEEIAAKTAMESVNQSCEKILKDIFYYSTSVFEQPTQRTNLVITHFSSLLVNLSKQSEISTQKTIALTEKTMVYTQQLYRLTWAIVALTVVLLLQGFFEIPKLSILRSQHPNQEIQQPQKNNLPHNPKPAIPSINQ